MTAAAVALPAGILVASANAELREQLVRKLPSQRGPIHVAAGGAEAFARLGSGNWQMLVLDRQLPDLNAEELVELTRRHYPGIEVVVVDSGAVEEDTVGAHSGMHPRPRLAHVSRSNETYERSAPAENKEHALPGMIGDAEPMRRMYRMVRLVARRNTTVLIAGPSGSGKELVARAIHSLSPRAGGSYAVLNCAAIPETLIESELFGYARGAFTGAAQTYAGRIFAAQGGTLFLDEIGELPLNAQSKLLRFLEQKEIQRLGSTETCKADVRVVAATNRNLPELVERGQFRDDLFFRLSAFPIEIPRLAERRGDIRKLAAHFLDRFGDKTPLRIADRALQMLEEYGWPGNVRELQQVLERAAILAEDAPAISPEHLVFNFQQTSKVRGQVAC
ncbi:MAG TPA: sigma-54 dependent transcriptional regulator [Terriglobales bacterium]|nr:sigma-54 dependent transcriptional regulator [Terriglobales bacterium]